MSGLQAFGTKAKAGGAMFGVVLFVGLMALVTLLSTLAWPGQLRYVGRLGCDAAHPDVMVVEDTFQTSDGTSTDFSVYCVSPGGDAIDQGFARGFVTLWGAYTVAVGALIGVGLARRVVRRRRLLRLRRTEPQVDSPVSGGVG
ncbi:hypothetical protein BH10ACT1_BH10ACT1_36370 [soil metagenome]